MTEANADPRVEALRNGDKTAFDAVYAKYRGRIYGFLVRLSGNRNVAADLFQNVWLKLARSAPRLREDTHLAAWLLTVARNEYIDYQRAQILDLSRLLAWGRHTEGCISHGPEGLRQDIEQALQAVGDADREVLLLVGRGGLSPSEAAEVLGVAPATFRQRLARARRRLAAALEEERRPRTARGVREERLGS